MKHEEIEGIVGELYEDREGDVYKLIADQRNDEDAFTSEKLIFNHKIRGIVHRNENGTFWSGEDGGNHITDIIKKHIRVKKKFTRWINIFQHPAKNETVAGSTLFESEDAAIAYALTSNFKYKGAYELELFQWEE